VGVQRQYSGTSARSPIARCGQLDHCHTHGARAGGLRAVPAESWTEDPSRRAEAHIPDEVTFKTKPELGVEMIERAIADGLPLGWCWPTARMATTPSFAGACAARVWATPSAYTVRPRCGAGFAGTPNR